MSISRVKPAGWGVNEKLTSGQQNLLDINVTYALDKRSGQSDTLASTVTVSGAMTFTNNITHNGLNATFNGASAFNGTAAFGAYTLFTDDVILNNYGSMTRINSNITFSGSSFTMDWTAGAGSVDVYFQHADQNGNGATGRGTYIVGQNATGTSSTGGGLFLKSGTGTSSNGGVRIYAGGDLMASFGPTSVTIQAVGSGNLDLKSGTGGLVRLYSGATQLASLSDSTLTFLKKVAVSTSIASGVVNVTFASPNMTLDFSAGNAFYISTATANSHVTATNVRDGAFYLVSFVQDGTGGRTLAWGGALYSFAVGDSAPGSLAGQQTIWLFHVVGSVFYCISKKVI